MLEPDLLVRRDLVKDGTDDSSLEFMTRLWVQPLTYAEVFAVKTALVEQLARTAKDDVGFDTLGAALMRFSGAADLVEERAQSRGIRGVDAPFARVAPAVPISSAPSWGGANA